MECKRCDAEFAALQLENAMSECQKEKTNAGFVACFGHLPRLFRAARVFIALSGQATPPNNFVNGNV